MVVLHVIVLVFQLDSFECLTFDWVCYLFSWVILRFLLWYHLWQYSFPIVCCLDFKQIYRVHQDVSVIFERLLVLIVLQGWCFLSVYSYFWWVVDKKQSLCHSFIFWTWLVSYWMEWRLVFSCCLRPKSLLRYLAIFFLVNTKVRRNLNICVMA